MSIISKETWDKFTQEEKEKVQKLYEHYEDDALLYGDEPHKLVKANLESIFPKEALQHQPLTYEDVARELFDKEGGITPFCNVNRCNEFTCTSHKQANKLLAINKLLNVAKYLNGDWKPDYNDENTTLYTFGIDTKDNSIKIIEVKPYYTFTTEIVSFEEKEFAEKAIQILGEDTVRLALTTEY